MSSNTQITIMTGNRALSLWLPNPSANQQAAAIAETKAFQDKEVLGHITETTAAKELFVDIGSSFGNYAIYAAGACGLRVKCFEPNSEARTALACNVKLNGLEQIVDIDDVALGRDVASAILKEEGGKSRLELTPGGTISVKALDGVNLGGAPKLMRIGVAGMELEILRGAEQTLRAHHPRLYVETTSVANAVAIVQLLQTWGYEAQHQLGPTPTLYFAPKDGADSLLKSTDGSVRQSQPPLQLPATAVPIASGPQSAAETLDRATTTIGELSRQLELLGDQLTSTAQAPSETPSALEAARLSLAEAGLQQSSSSLATRPPRRQGESLDARLQRLEEGLAKQREMLSASVAAIPQLVSFVNEQTVAARRLEAQVVSMRLNGSPSANRKSRPSPKRSATYAARLQKRFPAGSKKLRKLMRDPGSFINDSDKPLMKALSKILR